MLYLHKILLRTTNGNNLFVSFSWEFWFPLTFSFISSFSFLRSLRFWRPLTVCCCLSSSICSFVSLLFWHFNSASICLSPFSFLFPTKQFINAFVLLHIYSNFPFRLPAFIQKESTKNVKQNISNDMNVRYKPRRTVPILLPLLLLLPLQHHHHNNCHQRCHHHSTKFHNDKFNVSLLLLAWLLCHSTAIDYDEKRCAFTLLSYFHSVGDFGWLAVHTAAYVIRNHNGIFRVEIFSYVKFKSSRTGPWSWWCSTTVVVYKCPMEINFDAVQQTNKQTNK